MIRCRRLLALLALLLIGIAPMYYMRGFRVAHRELTVAEAGLITRLDDGSFFIKAPLPGSGEGGDPFSFPYFDPDTQNRKRSLLVLYEDGLPLPLPHSPLSDIGKKGGGRYRHMADGLYFSASDGTSPLENGRAYSLSWPWLLRLGWIEGALLATLFLLSRRDWPKLAQEGRRLTAWLLDKNGDCRIGRATNHFTKILEYIGAKKPATPAALPRFSPSDKNNDIQALRAVAAGLVLLQHFSLVPSVTGALFTNFTLPFYLGVELFFIISGFVVTLSLLRRRDGRQLGAKAFFIRRFFRLYPALLIFIILSATMLFVFTTSGAKTSSPIWLFFDLGSFARDALAILTGTFINSNHANYYTNGAMWTLSVEFQFYLAYGLIWFVLSNGALEKYREKIVLSSSLVLLAASLVLRFSIAAGHRPNHSIATYFLNYNFDFLLAGITLAFLYRRGEAGGFAKKTDVGGGGIFYLLPPLIIASHLPSPLLGEGYDLRTGILMPITLLFFSRLVWLAAREGVFARQNRIYGILVWLGDISYGVYIYHMPLLILVFFIIKWSLPHDSAFSYGLSQFIIGIPLIITFSAISYRLVEEKLNRLARHLLAKGSSQ